MEIQTCGRGFENFKSPYVMINTQVLRTPSSDSRAG
jgi:hypothetical protein